MFTIKVSGQFSSAHFLREYQGKCESLHGHNWRVETVLVSEGLDKTGMVADFKDLRAWLKEITDALDHKHLNETKPFDTVNPTSENMARYIYTCLAAKTAVYTKNAVQVKAVTVWENDNAAATYEE